VTDSEDCLKAYCVIYTWREIYVFLELLYGFQFETMIVQKGASVSSNAVRVIRKQAKCVPVAIVALVNENGRRNGIAYERSGIKES
jgi:hypothetical protein